MRADLAEQMEQMLRSLRQAKQRLTEAQARAGEASGFARSRDNLIEFTSVPVAKSPASGSAQR